IPKVARHPSRPAAGPGERWLERTDLYPVRHRVVSLLYAAAGGTPSECAVPREEPSAAVDRPGVGTPSRACPERSRRVQAQRSSAAACAHSNSRLAIVKLAGRSSLYRKLHFSLRREGDWRAFSFYKVEANLAWIHGLPPRRCACVQLGVRVRGSRRFLHRDSGFQSKSSASSRGRATRRVFVLRVCVGTGGPPGQAEPSSAAPVVTTSHDW